MNRSLWMLLAVGLLPASAGEPVRFATYNIEWLDAEKLTPARQKALTQVIEALDADVYGLQEIADRRSLEAIFPPSQWRIIIDDDSSEKQDLALVVRSGIQVEMAGNDADDQDFLFPNKEDNSAFSKRRDVLRVRLVFPNKLKVWVLVHHAKSRNGGRVATTLRRVEASRLLLPKLCEMANEPLVLLGDFNDCPDDASLNVLETGNPDAPAEMEERPSTFLSNLVEPLWAKGLVSMGWKKGQGDRLENHQPQSRAIQFDLRNSDAYPAEAKPILFDHILINKPMAALFVPESTSIYNARIADDASDHLPVVADFNLTPSTGGPKPTRQPGAAPANRADTTPETQRVSAKRLQLVAALPNPDGEDEGRESITLYNPLDTTLSLSGWSIRDLAKSTVPLRGEIAPKKRLVFVLPKGSVQLNNNGDTLELLYQTEVVSTVSYGKAASGKTMTF